MGRRWVVEPHIYIYMGYMGMACISKCLRFSLRVSAVFMLSGGRALGPETPFFSAGGLSGLARTECWVCGSGSALRGSGVEGGWRGMEGVKRGLKEGL